MKENLLNLSLIEFEKKILKLNEKKFRATQLFNWVYKKKIFNFQKIHNISQRLRDILAENFYIKYPQIFKVKHSKIDNSYKFLLQTKDNSLIESIAIIKNKKVTLCISCMIGCPLKCKFCATGTELKFKRNLDTSEIVGQYITIEKYFKKNKISEKINNIVFMGMGEPLLNIKNVEKSVELFTQKEAFYISKNKITISTVGITKNLSNFINKHKIKLAVSIHFPTDKERSKFMPINKRIQLKNLLNELKKIKLKKRDYITIEYLMIKKINDSLLHAQKLKDLFKNLKIKINLIPLNPTNMFIAQPSEEKQINKFANYLNSKSIFVTIRRSKGKDMFGGCGQFALKK